MQLEFAKYEGAGNDFILIDTRRTAFVADSKMIARLCDRHFGIGADGLMTLGRSDAYDCSMRYYNADGSPGEMCGNGGRCFALFARHRGIGGPELRFDSLDGPHTAQLTETGPDRGSVTLGMIDVERIADGGGWWSLDTGVPHCVLLTDDVAQADVAATGRALRYDTARFPQGTNVDFVQAAAPGVLCVRTYERGVEAETLACGTGATAAALVAHRVLQPERSDFEVRMPGGTLRVDFAYDAAADRYTAIRLTGPARKVFEGRIDTLGA